MTEAALAGRIDLVFAGEQPVLTLLSRSSEWRIVARLTSYRSAILVPTNSTVRSLAALKGKTIATAFGSTTHRDLARILADDHLAPLVKVVSLDQAEHASVIQRGGQGKWGEVDDIATYDPTIAAALAQGKARILHAWASPALVAVHQRLIATRRSDLDAFLRAYATAYTLYAANPTQANAWYSEESRLPLDDADYAAIAEFEPNMHARTLADVDVRITDTVLAQANRNAEVALELGIIKSKPDLQALADLTFFP